MIQQLTVNDFIETRTMNGKKSLHLNRPGKWFVFFSTTMCGFCKEFSKKYPRLAQEERKVNYGHCIVNEGGTNSVALKMKGSTTSITNVPYFLLYIDGKPKVTYRGERNTEPIKDFINMYLKKYISEQSQQKNPITASTRKAPVIRRDLSVSKEYYPEGYKSAENPDMGVYQGNLLRLPKEIRPWNEPYRYSGR